MQEELEFNLQTKMRMGHFLMNFQFFPGHEEKTHEPASIHLKRPYTEGYLRKMHYQANLLVSNLLTAYPAIYTTSNQVYDT